MSQQPRRTLFCGWPWPWDSLKEDYVSASVVDPRYAGYSKDSLFCFGEEATEVGQLSVLRVCWMQLEEQPSSRGLDASRKGADRLCTNVDTHL